MTFGGLSLSLSFSVPLCAYRVKMRLFVNLFFSIGFWVSLLHIRLLISFPQEAMSKKCRKKSNYLPSKFYEIQFRLDFTKSETNHFNSMCMAWIPKLIWKSYAKRNSCTKLTVYKFENCSLRYKNVNETTRKKEKMLPLLPLSQYTHSSNWKC